MDSRQPDPKRIRSDPHPWVGNENQAPRLQHGALSYAPGQPQPQLSRRRSEVIQHYEPEEAHRLSHTPAQYDSYGAPGPRDPAVKMDPGADRPQLQNMRTHSSGHLIEGRPKPLQDDPRVQNMPGYEPVTGPPASIHYHPPQSPLHPPHPQYHFEAPIYEQSNSEGAREQIYAEYTGTVSSSQKKRSPRTSQACEACRMAKAKCTDPKPCQGCQDKGIPCKYDPPAPKQTDRIQSDIMSRLDIIMDKLDAMDAARMDEMDTVNNRLKLLERSLTILVPDLPKVLSQLAKDDEAALKEEEEDDAKDDSGQPSNAKRRITEASSQVFPREVQDAEQDPAQDESENTSENETGPVVPPGELAIPVGHTTGAAKILQWPAVADMVGEWMRKFKVKGIDPLRRENRRGVIRLYGRGEGVERPFGFDKDVMIDSTVDPPRPGSDCQSETTPPADSCWGQIGGASPAAESAQTTIYRSDHQTTGVVDSAGLPDLDEGTIRRLTAVYMLHLNIMHPIITPNALSGLIGNFLKQIEETKRDQPTKVFASFTSSEAPGSKRKRSPTMAEAEHPYAQNLKPGRPQRSIGAAIVLLMLALGKICEHKGKIPDVLPDNEGTVSGSPSAFPFSPPSALQSPLMSSHSSSFPSPTLQERYLRRGSTDSSGAGKYPPYIRNLDVIPGLAYFAIATDILGNHIGATTLEFVHACLLAGLYHGQLGRVLQSHAFIKEAGYALSIILKPHHARYKKMQEDMSDAESAASVKWYPKDNPIIFTFWTCLQLESDIVAELEVPASGILSLEAIMPWPNLNMACANGEMNATGAQCYTSQLYFRKKLNELHRDLYGPGKENEYQLHTVNTLPAFPYIETIIENLKSVISGTPNLVWKDGESPSNDILLARLRAKMYGAQVITYRHFLRMVLNSKYTHPNMPQKEISKPIVHMAGKCIRALFYSTQAFWGMGPGRLIVTNNWGTSHAQWGNVMVLHAAYRNPLLSHLIGAAELRDATRRVLDFLISSAQPSSALADDIRILEYAAHKSGVMTTPPTNGQSFSSSASGSTTVNA